MKCICIIIVLVLKSMQIDNLFSASKKSDFCGKYEEKIGLICELCFVYIMKLFKVLLKCCE